MESEPSATGSLSFGGELLKSAIGADNVAAKETSAEQGFVASCPHLPLERRPCETLPPSECAYRRSVQIQAALVRLLCLVCGDDTKKDLQFVECVIIVGVIARMIGENIGRAPPRQHCVG